MLVSPRDRRESPPLLRLILLLSLLAAALLNTDNTMATGFLCPLPSPLSTGQRNSNLCKNHQDRAVQKRKTPFTQSWPPRTQWKSSIEQPRASAVASDSLSIGQSRVQQPHQKSDTSLPKHDIELLCCDMDGTILSESSSISDRNIKTVRQLIDSQQALFIPATGKSRTGALKAMQDLGKYLVDHHVGNVPGVYIQGLLVYGKGGEMVYENYLEEDIAWRIVEHAKELGVTLVAYNGDRIVAVEENDLTKNMTTYHEPEPIYLKSWEEVIGKESLHKFLFLDDPENVDEFRGSVEEMVGDDGVITMAVKGMLEVLPPGASKGFGVEKLIESYGVDAEKVMAIGDGENDLEMLKQVGVSVAMGNALDSVKEVAKYHVETNENHGVSEAIERFILSSNR